MKPATVRALNAINRSMYAGQTGAAFSGTRDHPWPGFARVRQRFERGPTHVLDVGCGNGRLAAALAHPGLQFVGVDQSETLLDVARQSFPGCRFANVDLAESDPAQTLPSGPFELVTLFGVLHHIPGEALRARLLAAAASRLSPGGVLAITFWRFAELARFDGHRLPWSLAPDVQETDLEPGDHLLRFGDQGRRYCHHSDEAERRRLLDGLDLCVLDRYRADGREGDLNDYVLLG